MNNIPAVQRRAVERKNIVSEILEPRVLLSSYDAAKDFSTTVNPNGVWTYGVRFTEFADFAPYPVATPLDFSPNVTGWSENSGSPPYVGINTTGSELDSEGIDLPTGVLVMHPGGNGEYSDVRFTVPQSGDVTVNFDFEGIDTNNTTTDVHVLYNNASVFDGTINSYGESVDTEPPLTIPTATQGGIIDFVVGTGSNGNFYNDATSLKATISTAVANDHLVFTRQPKNGIVDVPVTTQVKVVDSHGRIDKSVPDGVSLRLNVPAGSNATVTNAPFVYAPFINGVATFAPIQSPFIDTPGTYTLTAVADNSPEEQFGTSGVDSAVSKPFKLSGLHLAFTKQPSNCGTDAPVPFSFQVETDNNKPATGINLGQVEVLFPNDGNLNATIFTLNGYKYDNLKPPTGMTPLTLSGPGTYNAEVVSENPNFNAAFGNNNTNIVNSKPFTVFADHLAFTQQPATTLVGKAIPFQVLLEDYRNKPIPLAQLTNDSLVFTLNTFTGTGVFTQTIVDSNTPGSVAYAFFSTGRLNNRSSTDDNPISITAPGTYSITIDVLNTRSNMLADYDPVTSKVFKIK